MNRSTAQFRLSIVAVLATFFVVSLYVVNIPSTSQHVFRPTSSSSLSLETQEGIIAQVEGIFSTSARHIFDEQYWIANMHSIRSTQF